MKADNTGTISVFEKTYLPWFICCIGMLFYCFNYFLRVSPSVMQPELMQHLHITAYQFGNLAAFYYYAYTAMQIPVGMIYDRFGARMVLFFACLTAVSGLAIFISADNLTVASIGRFCIGLGTAFAYIGVLKIASLWLPANRFATVAGLTTAFGMASAIFSDQYLTGIVQAVGYQNALMTSLWVGIALSAFIICFMRSAPRRELKQPGSMHLRMNLQQLIQSVVTVLVNPQMWLIGIIGCLFYLPASVFLDLWGVPYLKNVYQLSPETAANVVCMTFIGWIVAGPTIGFLSDRIKRRRLPLMICAVMSTILLAIVFYIPALSLTTLFIIFFLIGIFCGAHPLCFALGKENSPNAISGTAVAITNTLIMLGGMVFQPVVGKLLDMHTSGVLQADGSPLYSASDYTFALSVVPVGLLIAIGLTYFLKETYCQAHGTLPTGADDTDMQPESNVVSMRP